MAIRGGASGGYFVSPAPWCALPRCAPRPAVRPAPLCVDMDNHAFSARLRSRLT